MAVIELTNVHKTYPPMWGPLAWGIGVLFREHRDTQPAAALRGVDLRVQRGTLLGLLGPSGSGKSTLLRIVAGLLSPSDGDVCVLGLNPLSQRGALLGQIGYVIRNGRSFYGHLSGYENLRFFAGLHGIPQPSRHHLILGLLRDLGLESVANQPQRSWSAGMTQRLAVARALLTSPSVLIMDEPTNGLDPDERSDFYGFLLDHIEQHDVTVLYATHDLNEAQFLCARIALMDRGQVVAQGNYFDVQRPARAIFKRPAPPPPASVDPGLAEYRKARFSTSDW